MDKWDKHFLDLAKLIATMSKDPSTQVGSVIVRPDRTIVSTGFNGFPRGMNDDEALYANRDIKIERIVHAEMNAILHSRESLKGCSIYIYPLLPCPNCAISVIQSGIQRVYAPVCPPDKAERWEGLLRRSKAFFEEAGLEVREVDYV